MANNEGQTILSILVPSIPARCFALNKLRSILAYQISAVQQHPMLGSVEIIVDDSPAFLDGGLTIGAKRDRLVKSANGMYLCFLDDDDTPAPNYVETLLRMCNHGTDVCTFQAIAKLVDYWALVDMRLTYKLNDQLTPHHSVRRPPWHMCPVRSDFAKMYQFKDVNNAEDFEWFEQVLQHCTTETHTEQILFQYNHGAHSEADKIERNV